MIKSWYWEASGRNGSWWVDRYDHNDSGHGTYGDALNYRTKREAEQTATALNLAFNLGIGYSLARLAEETVKGE
jgi:hypothetical protein